MWPVHRDLAVVVVDPGSQGFLHLPRSSRNQGCFAPPDCGVTCVETLRFDHGLGVPSQVSTGTCDALSP